MLKDALFLLIFSFRRVKSPLFLVSEVGFSLFFLKVGIFGVHGNAVSATEAALAVNGEFLVV